MAGNTNLNDAKKEQDGEFYTQYNEIQEEINYYYQYNEDVFRDKVILLPCDDPEWSNFTKFFAQNFERYGIKKLISTSYSLEAKEKQYGIEYQLSLFETDSPKYDPAISKERGKIFILEKDKDNSGLIDIDDLEWSYLEGDGDFRSEEVSRLRDEADIIITNPPFALFNEFLDWIMEAKKEFIIIGDINKATNVKIFPLIKNNIIWFGCSNPKIFQRPDGTFAKFGKTCWYSNIDHGQRHKPLELMTMEDNLKYNKKYTDWAKEFGYNKYFKYDNLDAIEVKFVKAIPSDYDGLMGVATSFLASYCPEQFEIVGNEKDLKVSKGRVYINGKRQVARVFIKRRKDL